MRAQKYLTPLGFSKADETFVSIEQIQLRHINMELKKLFRLLPGVPAIKPERFPTPLVERDPVHLSPEPAVRPSFERDGFIRLKAPFLSADFMAEVRIVHV